MRFCFRKPLFLIVDSENSWSFNSLPVIFGQPLVILMSPQELPPQFTSKSYYHGWGLIIFYSPSIRDLGLTCQPVEIWRYSTIESLLGQIETVEACLHYFCTPQSWACPWYAISPRYPGQRGTNATTSCISSIPKSQKPFSEPKI